MNKGIKVRVWVSLETKSSPRLLQLLGSGRRGCGQSRWRPVAGCDRGTQGIYSKAEREGVAAGSEVGAAVAVGEEEGRCRRQRLAADLLPAQGNSREALEGEERAGPWGGWPRALGKRQVCTTGFWRARGSLQCKAGQAAAYETSCEERRLAAGVEEQGRALLFRVYREGGDRGLLKARGY